MLVPAWWITRTNRKWDIILPALAKQWFCRTQLVLYRTNCVFFLYLFTESKYLLCSLLSQAPNWSRSSQRSINGVYQKMTERNEFRNEVTPFIMLLWWKEMFPTAWWVMKKFPRFEYIIASIVWLNYFCHTKRRHLKGILKICTAWPRK